MRSLAAVAAAEVTLAAAELTLGAAELTLAVVAADCISAAVSVALIWAERILAESIPEVFTSQTLGWHTLILAWWAQVCAAAPSGQRQ
jgi:hypothetical protein